jgi:NADH:ubiquinone oxidoreductase subunit 3 (subunit A)
MGESMEGNLINYNFSYFFIFFITAVAVIFSIFNLVIPLILAPKDWEDKNEKTKILKEWRYKPYESGELSPLPARFQYNIHYYMYAILFVIFDIEVLFFIPWVLSIRDFGIATIIEMFIFIIILLVGLYYAISKNALTWK